MPESGKNEQLKKNVRYLLWCVKNTEENYFDKDKIREKHIWKDVEWGKRSQNYNPLGKDPGNVWLPTEDDGKGKIINHIALDFESVINRCIDSTCLNNGAPEIVGINSSGIVNGGLLCLEVASVGEEEHRPMVLKWKNCNVYFLMEGCARKEKTSGRVNLIFFVEVEILETKFQLKFF